VVDDQPVNVELISGYLKKDYEIIPSYSGKEALEKIDAEKPDIVLLDIMMPGISGYEVCKKIKQQNSTRFIPVVIITALAEMEDKVKAIEAGADDFLTKPISGIELITRVRSLLKAKHFHDQLIKSKEKIEAQNKVRAILTNLLPILIQDVSPGKKNEVIRLMSKQVGDFIWTNYRPDFPSNPAETARISCSILNELGGNFSVKVVNERSFTVKNNVCPWGEYNNISPVLCMLTKAIFVRTGIHAYRDINVDVEKTIANGDGHCLLDVVLYN